MVSTAPPHVVIEIEDIRDKIKAIEAQLAQLEQALQEFRKRGSLAGHYCSIFVR